MTWKAFDARSAVTMRELGWSASKIGRHLGITKNAVLGKFYRLGLSQKSKNRHWSDGRRAKFIGLWMAVTPVSQIVREMPMARRAAYFRAKMMGLPSHRELTKLKGKIP